MSERRVEGKGQSQKRLIATGRKVGSVWQVRTFLRTAATTKTRETIWQAPARRAAK